MLTNRSVLCCQIQSSIAVMGARTGCVALLLIALAPAWQSSVRADHIGLPAVPRLRTPMAGEGYLSYQVNPLFGRFGDEWTGWTDIRHPSLAGAMNVLDPYDRSDRFFNVRTTVVTDAAGNTLAGAGAINAGRITDFDTANKVYMLQGGVGVLETAHRAAGATGAVAGVTFPVQEADPATGNNEFALIEAALNGAAPTIETYYAMLGQGNLGSTGFPSLVAGAGNESVVLDNITRAAVGGIPHMGFTDTFAHELYHFVGDGQAIHLPQGGDPLHSTDPRNVIASGNLLFSPGMAAGFDVDPTVGPVEPNPPWAIPGNNAVIGPPMTTATGTGAGAPRVGGVDQLTSAQVVQMFADADVMPWFPGAQRGDNHNAGHRVDWDWVVDHGSRTIDSDFNNGTAAVEFGLENQPNGADNHRGADSLYWGIGATMPSVHATHNHAGLGVFKPTPDFPGPDFRYADVFSILARYSDSDVDVRGTGNISQRESALDYNLFFQTVRGAFVQGVPSIIFQPGWSGATNADNFLVRWFSPEPAVGVVINAIPSAPLTGIHDDTAQIDAVIVATSALPPRIPPKWFRVLPPIIVDDTTFNMAEVVTSLGPEPSEVVTHTTGPGFDASNPSAPPVQLQVTSFDFRGEEEHGPWLDYQYRFQPDEFRQNLPEQTVVQSTINIASISETGDELRLELDGDLGMTFEQGSKGFSVMIPISGEPVNNPPIPEIPIRRQRFEIIGDVFAVKEFQQDIVFGDVQLTPVETEDGSVELQFSALLELTGPNFDPFLPLFELTGMASDIAMGDLTGDGIVDGFDIGPFVDLLTQGLDDYLLNPQFAEFPHPILPADFTGDGSVDGFDVQPFVAILTGNGVNADALAGLAIPEPATWMLFLFGVVGLVAARCRMRRA